MAHCPQMWEPNVDITLLKGSSGCFACRVLHYHAQGNYYKMAHLLIDLRSHKKDNAIDRLACYPQ